MGAHVLYAPIDATGENGFNDKRDGGIYSCLRPKPNNRINDLERRFNGYSY